MKKFLKSNLFYGIASLFVALLLFFNANAASSTRVTQTAQTYDYTVYDVPLQVEYDDDKYYVSGFPDTVTVHLSSLNRVKLNQESTKSTRTFKVVADLTTQSTGTVDVALRVTGLTSGVEAVVDPAVASVTIEKKVSKDFDVTPIISDTIVSDGYSIGKVTFDEDEVTVTTGEETMTQIYEIQAVFNANRTTTEDYSEDVQLQAVDKAGNVLPVTIDPARVTGKVEVIAPKKDVTLTVSPTGDLLSGITSMELKLKTDTISLAGPTSKLNTINSIDIPIDVSSIRKETTLTVDVPLPEKSLTATPAKVEVVATPIFASSSSSGTTPSSSSSSSSSSSTKDSSTSTSSTEKETESSESTSSSKEN